MTIESREHRRNTVDLDPVLVNYYMKDSCTYWCVDDVKNVITTSGTWTTDCCGFIRLCLDLNNKNLRIYPPSNFDKPRELLSGDLIFNIVADVNHILMVLYVEGDNVYLIDQGGLKQGTIQDDGITINVEGDYRDYTQFYHWN